MWAGSTKQKHTNKQKNKQTNAFLSQTQLPSISHLETRQFSSSLYDPGAFKAAIPLLELRASVCGPVSFWLGPLRGRLSLQEPPVLPGWNPHCFSQSDVVRASLPSTGAVGSLARMGMGFFAPQEEPDIPPVLNFFT